MYSLSFAALLAAGCFATFLLLPKTGQVLLGLRPLLTRTTPCGILRLRIAGESVMNIFYELKLVDGSTVTILEGDNLSGIYSQDDVLTVMTRAGRSYKCDYLNLIEEEEDD